MTRINDNTVGTEAAAWGAWRLVRRSMRRHWRSFGLGGVGAVLMHSALVGPDESLDPTVPPSPPALDG